MYCGLPYCAEACGASVANAVKSKTIAAPNWKVPCGDAACGCLEGNADLPEREKGNAMRAGHNQDKGFIIPHGGPRDLPHYFNIPRPRIYRQAQRPANADTDD